MKRFLLSGFCVLMIAGLGGCSVPWRTHVSNQAATTVSTDNGAKSGKMAPTFSLPNLAGGSKVSLKSLLSSGKPLIVNAFASWCGPCNAEAPDLERLAKQFHAQVTTVGVNLTDEDSVANAKNFVHKYALSYPILLDNQNDFADGYGVIAMPTTYVIAPSGEVKAVHQGQLSLSQMKALYELAAKQ